MAKHRRNVQHLVATIGCFTHLSMQIKHMSHSWKISKHIRNMRMMLRMFTCGLEKTQMFYYQESGLEVGSGLTSINILFTIKFKVLGNQ
jgi:hypothetical protein